MTLTIILIYLALVLAVGTMSHRLSRGTGEDFYVASRTIGPFFLLMSLFGTNMTAFAILGGSGEGFLKGVGVFALMPSSSALVIPSIFFFIGTRVWAIGKKHGYVTQIQFFRDRWQSDSVGLLLFIVVIALLIPYLLIGVIGGGSTLSVITKGQLTSFPSWMVVQPGDGTTPVPNVGGAQPWVGGFLVTTVVFAYVIYGGMRGTTWANVFQTIVFMVLGAVTMVIVIQRMGGLQTAMAKVAETSGHVLSREEHFMPLQMLSYTLVPLSVGMFPHLFSHWLTAKSANTFRIPLMWYPICIAAVWIPSVLLGILANAADPAVQRGPANTILIRMIDTYAPGVLAGLLCAGVFAAIMSSLDSQALSIGSMFANDIVRHYGFHDQMTEKQQVLTGRIFIGLILLTTFILAQVTNRSIFRLGVWCFSGYSALFPVVIAALFWRRSTKWGALASIITTIVLWIALFTLGWKSPLGEDYTIGDTGLMPVAVMLAGSAVAMIVVSLLTQPPDDTHVARFIRPIQTG